VFAVGGAGGLRRMLALNEAIDDFGPIDPALVIESILAASGEQGDLGVVQGLPVLPRWSRPVATGAHALSRLATRLGLGWRVLPNGHVWLGAETWPAYPRELLFTVEPDAGGFFEVAPDVPDLLPGMTLAGRRVVGVVYEASESGRIRARGQFGDDRSVDRGLADIARVVAAVSHPPALMQSHIAQVVTQDAAGHLGVRFVGDSPPMLTIDDVPVWLGVPRARAYVSSGALVQVAFAGGREDSPIAYVFETDAASVKIAFGGGGTPVARKGGSVHSGWLVAVAPAGTLGGPVTGTVIPYDPLHVWNPLTEIPLDGGIITDGWDGLEVPEP
jgi:hypothetical protein